jgi:organic radical activating enzyme
VSLLSQAPELGTPTMYGPLVARILRERWLPRGGRVTLAGGEPVLVRDFETSLRSLLASGLRVTVLTNATIFSPAVCELLASRHNRLSVLTSIDCGTAELYEQMKGRDLFVRAVATLGRYARTGGDVTAKYIVSSNNTDQREFDEFARHLRRERIRRAAISLNTDPATRFAAMGPDSPAQAIARLRHVLWRRGIDVKVMDFGLKEHGVSRPPRDTVTRRLLRRCFSGIEIMRQARPGRDRTLRRLPPQ